MSVKSLGVGLASLIALGSNGAVADESSGWNGIYVGLEGGFQTTDAGLNWASQPIAPSDMDSVNGFSGGMVAGINFQSSGGFVFGAETDLLLHDLSDHVMTSLPDDGFAIASDLLWSLSARGGYAINDDLLVFMKAGYSGMDYDARTTYAFTMGDSGWASGLHVGGGMEFRISDRLSAKAEYRYVNFESLTINSPSPAPVTLDPSMHVVLLGLNLQLP